MDLGSLFLILSLAILVALFVSRPVYQRSQAKKHPSEVSSEGKHEQEISALLAERDRILNTLQELDFDHAVGKIPEEDYPAQRAALVRHGAEVLRKLDIAQGTAQDEQASLASGDDRISRLEAAVVERREQAVTQAGAGSNGRRTPAGAADDPLEARIGARRRARQEKAAGFCPQCGYPIQKSDQFCPKCGVRLKREA
jgi:hypothetical protein